MRKLPTDCMDSGNESNYDGRISKFADKKWDDRDKRGNSECSSKETTIQYVDSEIKAKVVWFI